MQPISEFPIIFACKNTGSLISLHADGNVLGVVFAPDTLFSENAS